MFRKPSVWVWILFVIGFPTAILFVTQCHLKYPFVKTTPVHQGQKVILLWHKLGRFFRGFDLSGCQFSNCFTTMDRAYFNQSDAVIFPGFFQLDKTERDLPKTRPRNQYWIYQNMESQMRSRAGDRLKFLNGKINLTMTFLADSDIFSGYGHIEKGKTVQQEINLNKTKLVAWVVSHCMTYGKRELYFKELQKHIQADIFGKCNPTANCEENCLRYIARHYKFNFAAENTLCKDYITEKLYRNSLMLGLIPIVYGGANYAKHLPAGSYIDVKDFRTPKDLAVYLNILNNNDSLYREYFKWKQEFHLVTSNIGCNLCEMVNKKIKKVYNNLTDIWTQQDCISGEEYLKNIM